MFVPDMITVNKTLTHAPRQFLAHTFSALFIVRHVSVVKQPATNFSPLYVVLDPRHILFFLIVYAL